MIGTVPHSPYFESNPILSPYYHITPTFRSYYHLVEAIVIIEFVLIALAGLIAIFLNFYIHYSEKKQKFGFTDFKRTLLMAVLENKPLLINDVRKSRRKISRLLPMIEQIDAMVTTPQWENFKQEIAGQIFHPVGRALFSSRSWTKRMTAARCLAIAPSVEDEEALLQLLNDPIPIIQYRAALGAVNLGTMRSLDELLLVMSKTTRFFRIPLRDVFRQCNEKTVAFLTKKLEDESHPYIKVSCLEILERRTPHSLLPQIAKIIQDPHKNLRVAAIRVLKHHPTKQTIDHLIRLLDDPAWEVRAVAAGALAHAGVVEAIPKLTMLLRDKVWWVRKNAAMTLREIGEPGRIVLRMQDPDIDRYAYEIAKFVLT